VTAPRSLLACVAAFVLVLTACAGSSPRAPDAAAHARPAPTPPVPALRFIGGTALARQAGTPTHHLGGISGLDWDARTGLWYLLSDDRSEHAPARVYAAVIALEHGRALSIRIAAIVTLKQADGSDFPGVANGGPAPDPEALRLDPDSGDLLWSSEGDRRQGLAPFVRRATTKGRFVSQLPLPHNLGIGPGAEVGARSNLGIEGLAFTPDASSLWMAMEGPLYQDGPVATLEKGAFARFTRVDRQGQALGQYAYPLDPIPMPPTGGKKRADNGVSEILAVDGDSLLVVERSGREIDEHVFRFSVRIYEARFAAASNVAAVAALSGASFVPMNKRLVLDLDAAGIGHVDNIEAAAWGPRLPNGNRMLLLASDDNFHPGQISQFLAFEFVAR